MKIRNVKPNNHRKSFEVQVQGEKLSYPYSRLETPPAPDDKIVELYVDKEIGSEGFTCVLESGLESTVHIDQVLEYNRDPGYMKEIILYRITLEAQKRIAASPLSKRELIRRLGTSATQFYRLLDQANTRKSLGQMLSLMHILDCDVEVIVKPRGSELEP
ncbi:MAG: hypothetical protein O2954_03975 [bacterium]|nr:hypothetical protein [bacterium]